MQIPIVQERIDLSLRATISSALKISLDSESDDAVRVELSGSVPTAEDSLPSGANDGYLSQFFKYVGKLAEKLQSRIGELNSAALTESQRTAIQQEIQTLQEEFRSLKGGPGFSGLREQVAAYCGAAGSTTAAQSFSAFSLGTDFVNLLRGGFTSNLNRLEAALAEISSIAPEALSDGAAVSRLAELAHSARAALQAPVADNSTAAAADSTVDQLRIVVPKMTSAQYVDGSDVALSVKGYQGRDLIKAAVLKAVDDPQLASYIAIEPPNRSGEEQERLKKEDEQKRLQRIVEPPLSIYA